VHVVSGTYKENITLKDKVLVLGAGADVTTIDGGGTDSVVEVSGVGSSTKVDGFTITNGKAHSGGGIYLSYSSPVISDCTFSNNSPDDYGDCLAGSNDISQDPMFANPSAQDFHLMSGSPCIDAGTNDGAPAEDKDGEPHPIDGDWDGTATTYMGAYE